jgi:hypothetical protein
MGSHQRVQLNHSSQAIGDPAARQYGPIRVEQAQVMVALAPVDSQEQHAVLLCSEMLSVSWRRTCGGLMSCWVSSMKAG